MKITRMARTAGWLAVAGLLGAALIGPASAMATPGPLDKVTICHALPAEASHPYNQIEVDIASTGYVQGGHYVPGGALGYKHEDGGDIIPPYTYQPVA